MSLTTVSFLPDLSMKKCVPCSSKELRPMTEEAANVLIRLVMKIHACDIYPLAVSELEFVFVSELEFVFVILLLGSRMEFGS